MSKDKKNVIGSGIPLQKPEKNISQRQKNNEKIEANNKEIKRLEQENIELDRSNMLLSDGEQWFTEKEEDVVVSKRPKKVEKMLIGRVHWKEFFKDEDKPQGGGIEIERCEVVRVNGKWIV